jgi:hypothetical protein
MFTAGLNASQRQEYYSIVYPTVNGNNGDAALAVVDQFLPERTTGILLNVIQTRNINYEKFNNICQIERKSPDRNTRVEAQGFSISQ